jgi:hypothetical protein
MEIKKLKITKDATGVIDYTEILERDGIDHHFEVSKVCESLIHNDFKDAMAALVPHLIQLCDLREGFKGKTKLTPEQIMEDVEIGHIGVTSFTIDDAGEGVTLTGYKKIGNKQLNLNAPHQKFVDEHSPYAYGEDLSICIMQCKAEAEQYMEGKCAIRQTSMDFDEGGNDESHEETAKKISKKLKKELENSGIEVSFSSKAS